MFELSLFFAELLNRVAVRMLSLALECFVIFFFNSFFLSILQVVYRIVGNRLTEVGTCCRVTGLSTGFYSRCKS